MYPPGAGLGRQGERGSTQCRLTNHGEFLGIPCLLGGFTSLRCSHPNAARSVPTARDIIHIMRSSAMAQKSGTCDL